MQQGPFAPRALPRFFATPDLAVAVSSSIAFPVFAGYTISVLHQFPSGTKTVSPVARHVLATVLSLPPRRSDIPPRSDCGLPWCLRPQTKGSAFGLLVSRPPVGSLSLRPGDSLTAPRAALSVGFIRFVSSTVTGHIVFLRPSHGSFHRDLSNWSASECIVS